MSAHSGKTAIVTGALAALPIVRSVAQRVGRAELAAAGDTHGTHQSEFEVDLKPLSGETVATAKSALLKPLESFPGINVSATPS